MLCPFKETEAIEFLLEDNLLKSLDKCSRSLLEIVTWNTIRRGHTLEFLFIEKYCLLIYVPSPIVEYFSPRYRPYLRLSPRLGECHSPAGL